MFSRAIAAIVSCGARYNCPIAFGSFALESDFPAAIMSTVAKHNIIAIDRKARNAMRNNIFKASQGAKRTSDYLVCTKDFDHVVDACYSCVNEIPALDSQERLEIAHLVHE
jgi:hypothetical protein